MAIIALVNQLTSIVGSSTTGTVTATGATGAVTYTLTTPAGHGTAAVNVTTGVWTYTPAAGYLGTDTFMITITDTTGTIGTLTVNITVTNLPPTCPLPVSQTTYQSCLTFGVIQATSSATPITYAITTHPTNGTATISSTTGSWSYRPNPCYTGTDTFTVTATDANGLTCTVPVTITIVCRCC